MFPLQSPVVILADGTFPSHPRALAALKEAATVVCCDGAVEKLLLYGRQPDYIVGDMDTLSAGMQERFAGIIHRSPDQETNDLTKAVLFCTENNCKALTILGATGGRDDHSIANISLLADYATLAEVEMITDTGVFTPTRGSRTFLCEKGQAVSIFCLTPETRVVSEGLKYPTQHVLFDAWWKGSLNEASGNSFSLAFEKGKLIVFQAFGR